MSTYKVPQDVEADDKLIGPFSFRQFIYLIIVAMAGAVAWGLWNLLPPLVIVPLPVIIFFGALALPLRKDQPMETYLAAIVSFYIKPRKRLWDPDGTESLIEITAPKTIEYSRTKDLSQDEAQQRLNYLASIVDTQGWAVRGVGIPTPDSAMKSDVYFEAQQTEDVLDTNTSTYQNLDYMIEQSDTKRHQELLNRMKQPPTVPATTTTATQQPSDPYAALQQPEPQLEASPSSPIPVAQVSQPAPTPVVVYNPYPTDIHQTVIQPLTAASTSQPSTSTSTVSQPPQPSPQPDKTTSEKPVSPDIIKLVNNSENLSVETIAREANRIHKKEAALDEGEVVISLR